MFVAKNKFVAAKWISNPPNNIIFAQTSAIVSNLWLRISFHFFYFLGRIMISWKRFLFLFCWNEFSLGGTNLISWDRMLFRGEDFFFRRKEFYFVGTNFCLLERMLFRDTECYFVGRVFLFVGTNSNSCPLKQMF